jgi:hypothetical protein
MAGRRVESVAAPPQFAAHRTTSTVGDGGTIPLEVVVRLSMDAPGLGGAEARRDLYEIMDRDCSFEEKVERALALGERYLSVDNGHVAKIDQESDYWKAIASTDPPDGDFPVGLSLDLGETYCRRTATGESPVALHDAPAQGWADDPAYETHGLDCYHGTTITFDGEPYGTVCFVATDARSEPFSESETMFAELIARMIEHELYRERTERQLDRMDNFASILSHDLRNPLTVAQGHLDSARETDDDEDLRIVDESLDRIDELIDDVLTVARQGHQIDGTETVSLRELTDDCWGAVATADATLDVEGDLTFRADRSRTKQLFENLLRNAVEHGSTGPDSQARRDAVVRVGVLDDGDGFYVADGGPGIPEGERRDVFDAGYSTGGDGLGMGLAIVDSVVTAHDWRITVTSGVDGGARFEVRDVITVPSTVE